MKAVRNILYVALSVFSIGSMAACGGGGSTSPGGTSSVTTGQITGFGSVIVNGVKFSRKTGMADDRVKLRFDNNSSAKEDTLRIGMIVTIKGTTSGTTGQYESIEFQPEIRGPLDNAGVDQVNSRLTIMGREVQIEANTTFDSIRDLAEIDGELQAGRHPELEISGNLDSNGIVHATRIARKSADFTTGIVEIKGAIAASPTPASTGFSVGSQAVVVDGGTVFSNMAVGDIAAGLMVEVKGTLNAGVVTASRVERKLAVAGAKAQDNVRVKGSAVAAVTNNTFALNGPNGAITVTTGSATSFTKGGVAATSAIVTAGAILEVEGTLQANGSIAASKVSIELEKNVKLEGNTAAGAYNAVAKTLVLNGVSVAIAASTRMVESGGTLDPATIASGDHLQVVGTADAAGVVTASQIQRTSASILTFIQGQVAAKTTTSLTILGITVNTNSIAQAQNFIDNSSGTKVAGTGTVGEAQAAFLNKVVAGVTVVKAKGSIDGTTLTSSEVEIEQAL